MKCPVFISYSRRDTEMVRSIVDTIQHEVGVDCWIDLNGIESGEQFEDRIVGAIDSAEIVLFMLSDNAMQSEYAKMEVNYALNIKKKLVPIVLDNGELRGWFLFKFGGSDFIRWSDEKQRGKLIRNLKSWLTPVEPMAPAAEVANVASSSEKTSAPKQKHRVAKTILRRSALYLSEKTATSRKKALDLLQKCANAGNEEAQKQLMQLNTSATVSLSKFAPVVDDTDPHNVCVVFDVNYEVVNLKGGNVYSVITPAAKSKAKDTSGLTSVQTNQAVIKVSHRLPASVLASGGSYVGLKLSLFSKSDKKAEMLFEIEKTIHLVAKKGFLFGKTTYILQK